MIAAFRRFRSLERRDRMLVLAAACLIACVSVALRLLSYPRLLAALERLARFAPMPRRHRRMTSERVGWAVTATAARLGTRPSCLVQSIAAGTLLRRHGHTPIVRLGVRPGSPHEPLEAHAWVESDGRVVVGNLPDLSEYTMLSPRWGA